MKRISFFLLLSIFLASCSTAATPVPAVNVTFTSVPSSTPTVIPTTPTATEDPLKNAPDGTTRVENGNPLMDASDGYIYTWDEFLHSWTRPLIENYYAYDFPDFNAIPIDVKIKLGTPGSEKIVEMKHSDVQKIEDLGNVPGQIDLLLRERFNLTWDSMISGLKTNEGIPFIFTFNGLDIESNFGPSGGYTVTFVSEDELKHQYELGNAVRSNGNLGYVYLTYDGAENGRVLVRVASSLPLENLLKNIPGGGPEYEFRKMIFLPLLNILTSKDDLINVAAMTRAGIVASRSAFPRSDGVQDLQIFIK